MTVVANCSAYSPTEDKCVTCSAGNTLNTSSNKCETSIQNCQIYDAPTASNPPKLACKACAAGYYLDLTKVSDTAAACMPTTDKCTSKDASGCKSCANTFYLDAAKTCQAQPPMPFCDRYSGT